MTKTNDFFANDQKNKWMLFAVFAMFNIILSCLFRAPFAYPDEYGVFAAGNWMWGGVDWAYKSNMYYGYTFSPFVGILIRLFDGIRPVYIISLCIKSLQLAIIPLLAYKLLHEILGAQDARMKIILSSAVSLYPALTLYSKYVSNETTLHFTLFICLYLFGKCAVTHQKGLIRFYSVLLGFFAVFAYATHGMGLAFIVAVCFTIPVAHIFTKKRLVSYPIFIISFILFYLADSVLKAVLMETVYVELDDGTVNTFSYGFNYLITTILEPGAIQSLVDLFLTRLLYIMAATFGTFPLAFIAMLVFACRFIKARFTKKVLDPQDVVLFAVVLFCFAIFLCGISLATLSSIQSEGMRTAKAHFYGRYYEYMALPLILVGLQYLFNREIAKKTLVIYSVITIVCYTVLSFYLQIKVIPFFADGTTNLFFILGVVPFIGNTSAYIDIDSGLSMNFNLYTLWVFTTVVFFLMMYMVIAKSFKKTAVCILICMFLYGTIYDLKTTVLHLSVANYDYFYSSMEPIKAALDEFNDVYEQYPNLYIVTNSLGSEDSPNVLIRSRAQLSFFRYSVAGIARPHLLDQIEDSQMVFDNAILVSDENLELEHLYEYEGYEDYVGYTKIYESSTACIWIHGDDITAYYNGR